jgi:hypothetical protein
MAYFSIPNDYEIGEVTVCALDHANASSRDKLQMLEAIFPDTEENFFEKF